MRTWASYLTEVIHRPGWSIARLARESGVHRSTIFRWLRGEVNGATVHSVLSIATATGDDPDEALRAAAQILPVQSDDPDAEAVALIMAADLSEDAKQQLVSELRELARTDAE